MRTSAEVGDEAFKPSDCGGCVKAWNYFPKFSLSAFCWVVANWPRIGGNTYARALLGSSVGTCSNKYLIVSLRRRDNQYFHNSSMHTVCCAQHWVYLASFP